MSLTDSPDRLFRPEDKALKMLFPTAEETIHNSFDEFFDKELYGLNNDDDGQSPLLLDEFFPVDRNRSPSPSPNPVSFVPQQVSPQPWRKGLWCLNSKPKSELIVEKTRKLGRFAQKFVSPTHLGRNDNFAKSPISTTRTNTKTTVTNPGTVIFDNDDFMPRAMACEQKLPTQPIHAQLPNGKMMHSDNWQHDFQNIHLQMPDNGTYLSSGQLKKSTERTSTLCRTNLKSTARNATVAVSRQSPTKYHYPFNHVSRPERENFNQPSPDVAATEIPKHKLEQLYNATYASTSAERSGIPVWTTESLHSSDSSHQSHSSHFSSELSHSMYQSLPPQAWMSPPQIASASFSPHDNQVRIVAPVPQRVSHQVLRHQHHGGLGIHYANANEIGRALSYGPTTTHGTGYRPITPPYGATNSTLSFPPLPPYPTHLFEDDSPFTTPRRGGISLSRSPSPSVSPTRRSPTRSEHTHTRRKSLHKPGPIKTKDKEKDKDATYHSPRHRTRSSSRPPKTPRTPTSATPGQIDFVNFTPKDSAKLMSDVAPSGSSKTRARREQEAREKRKRLSEAALQAVRNAGGDVAALEEAIFV